MALSNGVDLIGSHELRIVKLEDNQSNLSSMMAATNEHIASIDKKLDTFSDTVSSKIDDMSVNLIRQDERKKMDSLIKSGLFALFLALVSGLADILVHVVLKLK
ncbi:MAG: hypothetical protein KGO96_07395 [Elusimicrobia bacterium]|nr:hypothetical protein [Elusimicrobiota bacterium]